MTDGERQAYRLGNDLGCEDAMEGWEDLNLEARAADNGLSDDAEVDAFIEGYYAGHADGCFDADGDPDEPEFDEDGIFIGGEPW